MDSVPSYVWSLVWVVGPLLGLILFHRLILRLFGVIMIPEDSVGIVNKKFVLFGRHKTLPDGAIIAQNGEAGIQADTLAPGIHFLFWPWQYAVRCVKFTTVPDGMVGVISACDGRPIADGRVLGKRVDCDSFQDARDFLLNGGERGPQLTIIPPGNYRINTELFTVTTQPALEIPDNQIGIVTTKDGTQLPTGEIAGREVSGHNMFQDAQGFIDHGGFKGLQEQVMLAGRYYVNPLLATVEVVEMTEVPIAHAGVVIAFVGEEGKDVTGDAFKHGNLVDKGKKGVWVEPLDPGKYPINTRTHRVEMVPTANVVLNWATGKTEAHLLDERLSTIKVRSSDGFDFTLDVSQIIHIPRTDAPRVVARFGTVANLVTQVLEPTIGNYFRNAAQTSDAIEFLNNRKDRQEEAKAAIRAALEEYNVGAVDTLIGDINPPPALMKTLTDRKIAQQEKETFNVQRQAQEERQKLEQATALAATQSKVVDAERKVAIAQFEAKASVEKAKGDSEAKTINAEADAKVTTVNGDAEARKVTAVGRAEAGVINAKTNAIGQGNFALIEVIRALAAAKIPLVPQVIAGGGDGGGNPLINLLLAQFVKQQSGQARAAELVPFETHTPEGEGSQ